MKEQMTLGQIIDVLRRKDPTQDVTFDFVHFKPDGVHSYRGNYSHLAIGYGHDDITVGGLLKLLEDADGETFQGYKGGDYEMGRDTPVWVANRNEAGGTAVVDVEDAGWRIVLATAAID